MINSYLKSQTEMSDESVHLLFSSNRWECNKEVRGGKERCEERRLGGVLSIAITNNASPALRFASRRSSRL
jgi:hypothetical protein